MKIKAAIYHCFGKQKWFSFSYLWT